MVCDGTSSQHFGLGEAADADRTRCQRRRVILKTRREEFFEHDVKHFSVSPCWPTAHSDTAEPTQHPAAALISHNIMNSMMSHV